MPKFEYVHDGAEIYRRSFATIRAEADLARFPDDVAGVVVRMIHSCGMTDLPDDVGYSDGVVTAARVRLVPRSPERVTSILAFSSTAAAVEAERPGRTTVLFLNG